ncbi:thioredoxin domain-containing protein [Candidatus Saccharibacteria bacterium]|nr:thioredoxin domain-containing protein [Candidatus Saccharibacteria bacterium]
MSKKTWIIFIILVVGLLAALVVSSRNASPKIDISSINANSIQPASAANGNIAEHVFGKADSKVVLVEYGDFQCPACGVAYPRIKAITEAYKDELGFVFRNFPLMAIHANAKAAAATVEAAGLQGKYWEMYNMIYQNQKAWSNLSGTERTGVFVGYAAALGLDEAKFETDLTNPAIAKKISFDQTIGKKIGADATPTFYLNGVKLTNEVWGDDAKLKAAIDSEFKKAGITPPTTIK